LFAATKCNKRFGLLQKCVHFGTGGLLVKDEDRLIKLETDMAYLQDMVRELNDIVAGQQVMMTKLEKQNEALNKRIEDLDTEARPNRRPPHY